MKSGLFAFLLFGLALPAWAQGYVINNFFVDITLRADASMQVREQISVTFQERRRGIFRTIPVDLPTQWGTTRRVLLRVVSVTDDKGEPATTKITREGAYLKIRIGDPDVWLPSGTAKTYVITYEALGMINWFDEVSDWEPYAELYWNVTGNEWDTVIEKSSFRVRFPLVEGGRGLRLRVYAGPYGSTAQGTVVEPSTAFFDSIGVRMTLSADKASAQRDRPLYPGEGLTLVLNLPAQTIEPLSLVQRAELFLLPNLGFALPFITLVVMSCLWWFFGRDPYAGPTVVQYDPPDNLTGPEAGALIDERVDRRDLTAGVFSLAVKGYVEIHYNGKKKSGARKRRKLELVLTGKKEEGLTLFERKLLQKLREAKGSITEADLRSEVATYLGELKSALYQSLVERGYYRRSPQTVRTETLVIGGFAVVGLAVLSAFASPIGTLTPPIVGGVLSLAVVGFFARGMPMRTPKGARAHRDILGFEEFMRRARGQELDWMTKKHPDAALFEKYLPHAVAFGLLHEWCEAFKDVLQEPPSWYHDPYQGFRYRQFSRDMERVSSKVDRAVGTPPRSAGASGGHSGFSSGGFSGGGFGGGGGGSW